MALAFGSLAGVAVAPSVAFAQSERQLEKALQQAMDDYDILEIGAAEKKLEDAIDDANSGGVTGPVLAKLYVMLGVVRFAGTADETLTREAFVQAVQEDPAAAVPDVYLTPDLEEIMSDARDEVGVEPKEKKSDKPTIGITHTPITDVTASEPVIFEAFVPRDMPVYRMWVFFRIMGDEQWKKVELQPTNAERFAVQVPGDEFHSSQFDYYIHAEDRGGNVIGNAGTASGPINVVVLGSSGIEKPPPNGGENGDEDLKPTVQRDSIAYVSLLGGTSPSFLFGEGAGNQPTANPVHPVTPGLAIAFGHVLLDAGVTINERMHLGLFFRYQFAPYQDFAQLGNSPTATGGSGFWDAKEECLRLGLPGDCILGLKYKYFISDSEKVRIYSSVGAGVGRTRNWLRLKQAVDGPGGAQQCEGKPTEFTPVTRDDGVTEDVEFCYVRDTVRLGWLHFGVGGGAEIPLNDILSFVVDGYLMFLAPVNGLNLDLSGGLQVKF